MDDAVSKHKEDANRNDLLIWACARGLLGDAKELVKLGADAAVKDKKGVAPLHYAASHGHKEVAEFLVSRGVDLEVEDPQGRTPMHFAAAGSHVALVELLATKSVWLDSYDADDDTALHIAARRGNLDICQLLADKGAKLNLANKRGLTPLGEALVGGHVEVAEMLLAKGAQADFTSRGFTLLHLVCGLGLKGCAKLLLGSKVKADPNEASNSDALTPLHAAAMAGSLACVELLLEHGASAAAQSASGLLASELVPQEPSAPGASGGKGRRAAEAKEADKARAKLEAAAAKAGGKGSKAPARVAAAAAAAKPSLAEEASESFEARFARLPRDEQIYKVNSYVRMDDATLPKDLPSDGKAQLQEMRKATQMLECVKAVAALRGDEEFQQDIVNPAVRAAMDIIKKTNDETKFREDSRVQGVMMKMKRLRAVLKNNGDPQLSLEDVLSTPTGPKSVDETLKRIVAMEGELAHMREQAVLLLGGKAEEPKGRAASTGSFSSATSSSTKGSAKAPEAARAKGATAEKAAKATSSPAPSEPRFYKKSVEIEELPDDKPVGPPKAAAPDFVDLQGRPRPTTWKGWIKEFGFEMARQMGSSLLLLLLTMAAMWLMGMLPGKRLSIALLEESDLQQAAAAVKAALHPDADESADSFSS